MYIHCIYFYCQINVYHYYYGTDRRNRFRNVLSKTLRMIRYMSRQPKLKISWRWGKQYTSPVAFEARPNRNKVQLFVWRPWYRQTESISKCTLKDLSNDIRHIYQSWKLVGDEENNIATSSVTLGRRHKYSIYTYIAIYK